ncbi:MAG: BatD family protein [Thermoanaerobaculia bacterium]|nr:BatD family protein [Thermoanaerobaculia bacterium]
MIARRLASLAVLAVLSVAARGDNELTVEPRSVPADESVRITLVLRDSFASIDSVELPLENLEVKGPPSTSVEVAFVNGVTSRKKTLTWWATPKAEGAARVGPLVLVASGSARDELPAVEIAVVPQPVIDPANPAQAFTQLDMSGRDQVLLIVDVPKTEVWQGDGIDVTWYLYTAVSIRRYSISVNPKLDGFWVEEEPVENAVPEEVIVGGRAIQRVAIRRATLFPLRAGALEIPAMEAGIEVIRRMSDPLGSFGMLEGRVVDVKRKAVATRIMVRPLPGAVDVVGAFTMGATAPKLSPSGTVSFDVTVRGIGSLRATRPPRWLAPVDADVQIEELDSEIASRGPLTMTRRWRYVLFPRAAGRLAVPGLTLRAFDPSRGEEYSVSAAGAEVVVPRAAARPGGGETKPPARDAEAGGGLAIAAAAAALVCSTLLAAWLLRGRRHDKRELVRLMAHAENPRDLRRALADLAASHGRDSRALFAEAGELGDAWRSVHSFADLVEKEPGSVSDARRELRKRAVRLLPLLRRTTN